MAVGKARLGLLAQRLPLLFLLAMLAVCDSRTPSAPAPLPPTPSPALAPLPTPSPGRTLTPFRGLFDGGNRFELTSFTVRGPGPVDALAQLSVPEGRFGFAILRLSGHDCRGVVDFSPYEEAPKITAHWDAVPVGTYCMNVVAKRVYDLPYTWTGYVVHP